MLYRELGNTGKKLSLLGFGCWAIGGDWTNVTDEKSIDTIKEAIESGINFFDVAPVYGFNHAEEILGRAIKNYSREDIYIATKCGLRWDKNVNIRRDLSRENILREVEESLKRLDTDYIDLYQMHWPDPNAPIKESMDTLMELQEEGVIKHIGGSNFNVNLLENAKEYGEIVSDQVLFNMIDRNSDNYHNIPLTYRTEKEILPYCLDNKISVIPYSPLAQGLLANNFNKDKLSKTDVRNDNPQLQNENLEKNKVLTDKLNNIIKKYNKPLAQLTLKWLIDKEAITSIIVSHTSPIEVRENLEVFNWEIDERDMEEVNKIVNDQYI